jgi:hypothetical protein
MPVDKNSNVWCPSTLGEVVAEHFGRHRDADIYASQPGVR